MKITKKTLKDKFIEYNKLYFNNKLPMCNFKAVKYWHALGTFYRKDKSGKCSIYIRSEMFNNVEWSEKTLRSILVHEMIHYYVIYILGIKTRLSPHNILFRIVKNKLNKKYDLGIVCGYPSDRIAFLEKKKTPTLIERLELTLEKIADYLAFWII